MKHEAIPGQLADQFAGQFAQQRLLTRTQPGVPWEVRAGRLRRMQALLKENRAQLAAAISADFGNRPTQETEMLELFPSLEALSHALAHGKKWMRPRRRATGFWFLPASSSLLPQPLGVVGVVTPWNYPLYLTVGPLASAFAAGNRAMVKLSEFTPAFGALFAELVRQRFQPDELAVVNGDAQVAQEFCALPWDHLLFTGSTAVGHHVMRAASAHLTPVTLELGGKSPAIIGPGADFGRAVERILVGKLLNAGQTCIAPDYVLLPAGREQDFIQAARAVVAQCYPGFGAGQEVADYTSIISPRHFARLQQLLDGAAADGATLEPLSAALPDPARRVLPPVALLGVPDGAQVMREEIFGPLLPLVPYTSLDQALAYVNARPRPLALYIFERDRATVAQVLQGSVAGGVTVNDTILHIAQDDLPFGGVGPSGMGCYHGEAGFQTFSHMKPVFRQSRLNGIGLVKPPYGKTFQFMVRLMLGR